MPSGKVAAKPRASDLANGSDDDGAAAGPSGQGKTQRIAKGEPYQTYTHFLLRMDPYSVDAACDRCRKSKSKCEPAPNEGDPCKSCASTGAGEVIGGISRLLRLLNYPSCTAFYRRMHLHGYDASVLMCLFVPINSITRTAPSFRRGPPKGYIQALEHRLHQVESVLAAIMSSTDTRAQSIVEELSQDELAGYILESVDAGPFVRIPPSCIYMRRV